MQASKTTTDSRLSYNGMSQRVGWNILLIVIIVIIIIIIITIKQTTEMTLVHSCRPILTLNQMLKKEKLNHSDLCAIVDAVMNVNLNHHYHIINLFDR